MTLKKEDFNRYRAYFFRLRTANRWATLVSKYDFATYFARYAPKLESFFLKKGLSIHDTEDLTQESFMSSWQQLTSFTPLYGIEVDERFVMWLNGFAKNKLRNFQRKRRECIAHDGILEEIPSANNEPHQREEQRLEEVKREVSDLPIIQKKVIHLKYYQGLTREEIAASTGVSVSKVKRLLAIAKATLRESLEEC